MPRRCALPTRPAAVPAALAGPVALVLAAAPAAALPVSRAVRR
ncbi:hypothetical protein [Kitasatospora purpeofusca]